MLSIQIDTKSFTTSNWPFLQVLRKQVFQYERLIDVVRLLDTFEQKCITVHNRRIIQTF